MKQSEFSDVKHVLEEGGIFVYPTETFYGLGCDPFSKEAVMRVAKLKGRKSKQVPLLLIPNREWLYRLVRDLPSGVLRLIDTFWPGPLTIALPARETVPRWLRHRDGTVAVRISSHPWVKNFFSFYDRPIVSTSANLTGKPPAHTPSMVQAYFPQGIDYVVDGGDHSPHSKGSTVVSFNGRLKLVREGVIPYPSLKGIYGGC